MARIVIGIDPGQKGAISFLLQEDTKQVVWIEDIPLLPNGEISALDLRKLIAEHLRLAPASRTCAIEKAQPMPRQSAQSGFNYGVGYGVIKAVLTMLRISFQEIPPIKWKKAFSLPKVGNDKKRGKQEAITKCLELFPDVDKSEYYGPKGGMKDGRAESLLLAEYARRFL